MIFIMCTKELSHKEAQISRERSGSARISSQIKYRTDLQRPLPKEGSKNIHWSSEDTKMRVGMGRRPGLWGSRLRTA